MDAAAKRRRTRGFTLIEALISMTILTSGLLVCAGLFAYATVTTHETERESLAAVMVADKLEELRRKYPSDLNPGGTVDRNALLHDYAEYFVTNRGLLEVAPRPGEAELVRVWQIAALSPTRIEVAVYATSRRRRNQHVPLAFGSTSLAP